MLGKASPVPHSKEATLISLTRFIALLVIASALLVGATSSFAKGGDDGVRRSGDCTGQTSWKLKAKPDDGRIETEFEVDQNRTGMTWDYRIRRNGRSVARGTCVTRAPSADQLSVSP